MITDYFEADFVGQRKVRRQLSFYIDSFKTTGIFKNCLFLAQKGQGKTLLARAVAERLNRPYYEINCETVRSVTQFYDQVLDPLVIDKECTLMFDELHSLNRRVVEFLLSILQPNREHRNTVRFQGQDITIDFRNFTFLGATTEPQKIFSALKDRLKCITLSDYSLDELKQIIQKSSEMVLSPGVLDYLGNYCRSNARAAWDLGQEIQSFCQIRSQIDFSVNDAKELISILNLYEFGFSELEVQILNSIANSPNASLTRLAAKSGLTPQAQRDFERAMLAKDLIEVTRGRSITRQGREYLTRNIRYGTTTK